MGSPGKVKRDADGRGAGARFCEGAANYVQYRLDYMDQDA